MTLTRDHLASLLAAFAPEGIDLGWLRLKLPPHLEPVVRSENGAVVVDLSKTPIAVDPDVPCLGNLGKRFVSVVVQKVTLTGVGVTAEGEVSTRFGVVKSFKRIVGVQS